MIAAWMLYCSLCACGLLAAGVLAERALLKGRAPVRFVWAAALFLSVLVPAVMFRVAPRSPEVIAPVPVLDVTVDGQTDNGVVASASASGHVARTPQRDWRATFARFDDELLVLWLALSLAVALNFLRGMLGLVWMRRRWQRRDVLGVPVFVSERTGPAVIGAITSSIVVPEWVLELEPEQLALMLRHEHEHRRAGDARLLAVAQLTLIAMPWNLALWWQILRLRVAVELDCDARVLRDADVRSYGDLLLEVARPRRGPQLMGATAFAERATQLERRIRVMVRQREVTARAARVVAGSIALIAVTIAWIAPHPRVLARAQLIADTAPPIAPEPQRMPSDTPPPAPTTPRGNRTTSATAAAAATNIPSRNVAPESVQQSGGRGGGPGNVEAQAERTLLGLFDGIALTPEQGAKARGIIIDLQQQQNDADRVASAAMASYRARVLELERARNAQLRALLTNDADRATFDARIAPAPSTGRGRGGGPGTVPLPGSGARGGGGGRGGTPVNSPEATALMTDLVFGGLFDGMTLTPEQSVRARTLIANTHEQAASLRPNAPLIMRFNARTGVASLQAPGDSLLLSVVSSDADRALLQSRISSVPR
jgi:beta-lactamase regulating signal transducer with metallopeptidase domain